MAEKILVVDDEKIIRESLAFVLRNENYDVDEAENGLDAYQLILNNFYDLVISDIEMPGMKGIDLLEKIKALNIQTSVIIITAFGSLNTAISALRNGAADYILKPVEFDEIIIKLKRLFEVKNIVLENRILRKEIQRQYDFEDIIGKSPSIKKIYEIIKSLSETSSTILITGKSGTGKEVIARALHFNSSRRNKPFVAFNCGAIAENLFESELFGYKKGAFTGANFDKEGFIKAADNGTLFLDEISEMPFHFQVKLLRILQEKEFTPVGQTSVIKVDVRIIATTNKNLREEVKAGRFREDLFYRLNVVEINLPSLTERTEDIPLLADHFLVKYRKEMNKNIKGIENKAMNALLNYRWEGEIRELENVIERAVIFCKKDFITLEDLPQVFSKTNFDINNSGSLESYVRNVERDFILQTLKNNNYNKEMTSNQLNVGISTLYRKIKELNINI